MIILLEFILGLTTAAAVYLLGCIVLKIVGPVFFSRYQSLAPFLGVSLLSLLGTIELVVGFPVGISGLLCLAGSIVVAVCYFRKSFFSSESLFTKYAIAFFLCFGLLSTVPFPGQWIAGGDWYVHLEKVITALDHSFGPHQIDRSPFYSLGAAPFFWYLPPLQAFMVHTATMGASTLLLFFFQDDHSSPLDGLGKNRGWIAMTILAPSPFFIISLQNMWPKLASGGCLLIMILMLFRPVSKVDREHLIMGWLVFWIGLAFHASHIIYGVLLFLLLWRTRKVIIGKLSLGLMLWLIIPPIVLIGLYEGWSLLRFGIEAKIASNPTMTYHTDSSFFVKIAQNILSTLVGDQAIIRTFDFWKTAFITGSASGYMEAIYFTAAASLPWLSGSMIGILIVLLPIRSQLHLKALTSTPLASQLTIGFSFAIVSGLVLAQGNSHWGLLQAVFPASILVLYWWITGIIQNQHQLRRLQLFAVALGALPFFLFSFCGLIILNVNVGPFPSMYEKLKSIDGDLMAVTANQFSTFASKGFPVVPCIATVGFFLAYRHCVRRATVD